MIQVGYFLPEQLTLGWLQFQSVFLDCCEDEGQVFYVFFQSFAEDQQVVKVDYQYFKQSFTDKTLHETLKRSRGPR